MKIDRPIFLLGPGRSGSTLLNNLLTLHRDVGYFVSWSSRYPKLWMLAFGARLRWWRLEAAGRRMRFYPGPTEAYAVWKHCFPDFWAACRRPCDDGAGARELRRLMEHHLRLQGASRFVSKLTGPPMFDFFRSIFPDARFVWVDRDPRAVVHSLSKRRKIRIPDGLTGEEARAERLRQAAERYLAIYDELAACGDDHHLLIYGDFVRRPRREMERLLEAVELEADSKLSRILDGWSLQDADDKWRRELTDDSQELLHRLLERPLRERGLVAD